MTHGRKSIWLANWFWLLIASAGCAGVHLHNQADADFAKAAQDQFKAADVTSAVAGERKVIDALLDRELLVMQRQFAATRDAGIIKFVGGTDSQASWGALISEVNGRLHELAGNDVDNVLIASRQLSRHVAELKTQELLYAAARTASDPELSWPLPPGVLEDGSGISTQARGTFINYVGLAKSIEQERNVIENPSGGLLKKLSVKIAMIRRILASINATAAIVQANYDSTAKAYEAALVSKVDPLRIKQIAGQVIESIDAFDKLSLPAEDMAFLDTAGLSGLTAIAKIKALEKKRDGIFSLLDRAAASVKTGTPSTQPSDSKQALFLLTLTSDLPAIADAVANAKNGPNVSALLLESQRLQLLEDAAKRQLASAQQQIDLLEHQRGAMVLEMGYLNDSYNALSNCGSVRRKLDGKPERAGPPIVNDFSQSLAQDFNGPAAPGKEEDHKNLKAEIAGALLGYANSWTLGRTQEEEMDYRLIHVRSLAALDSSQSALAQWNNLIGVPLGQLATLHEGGLTTEDVARLLDIVAYGVIGYGVNR